MRNAPMRNAPMRKRKETPMIPEDMSPSMVAKSAPLLVEDAAARISAFTSNGLEGLCGMVFASIEQFHNAMIEVGFRNVHDKLRLNNKVMESTNVVTYTMLSIGKDGDEWAILINGWPDHVEIVNCVKVKGA